MPTRNNRLAAIALTQGMVDPFRIAEFLEPILHQSGVDDWLAFFVEKGLLTPEQVERLQNAYAAADPGSDPPSAPAPLPPPSDPDVAEETEASQVGPIAVAYEEWMRESDTIVSVDISPTRDTAAARSLAAEAGRRAGVVLPGADLPPGAAPSFPSDRKFALLHEIGRGGVARVLEAFDRDIGRRVALKILRDPSPATPRNLEKLIEEAQITGQLEHPNIVPVHDLGLLPSGEVFFAMRLVRGRTLAEILRRKRAGEQEAIAGFSRTRLLTIFQQICMALDFVHDRGVIHRDLKPENILIGDHGEVYVMDWGLARVLGRPEQPAAEDAVVTLRSIAGSRTVVGTISGTPSYMPPEQAMGNVFELDARSDVYSLGAILYEILTLLPPFSGHDAAEILAKVVGDEVVPPRTRAPERDIAPELEEICLKALRKKKGDRPARARELHAAIEAFLEGSRERRRKRIEATERIRAGREAAQRYQELREELRRHESAAREAARTLKPWAALETKRHLWELQDLCETTRARMAETFAGALEAYSQAMGIDPTAEEARDGPAELYLERIREAEAAANPGAALHFRTLLTHFAGGRYAPLLSGDGRLRIVSQPAGARVTLFRYREHDRVLVAGDTSDLGSTPTAELALSPGSYLAVLAHENYPPVRAPVEVERGAKIELKVPLCGASELGERFVYVPAGQYLSGGDPLAPFAEERHAVHVGAFGVGKFPVTCAEYLEYLNDLWAGAPEEAQARAPRATATSGVYWTALPGSGFTLESPDPDGDLWDPRWPVIGISWNDAVAYCAWHSRRTGRTVRLPTHEEWEKAARGTDGRIFPWGNRFDATFCKMESSRDGRALPEPIGAFPTDESPYGVRDLAGTVQEWTASRYSEGAELRVLCGGSWRDSHLLCRATWHRGAPPNTVSLSYGFRLALSL